tara:strand:- start:312 stop:683 length:372 start_codon:yes stop_codon:yes gene_type:complete
MSFTKVSTPTALADNLITCKISTTSGEANVTGNTSGKIYQVKIDNTGNLSTTAYVKIADSATVIPGQTTAAVIFPVLGGKSVTYLMDTGLGYTAGVSVWCSSTPETNNASTLGREVEVTLLAT